ncbi:MAG: hypothetical protein KTR35_23915 [Gammaproteobacteria bacterium]|nr:hypothetical protein [Gammaproteobacteria bacterium]
MNLKGFSIVLVLLVASCDAGILLCGRYVCVAAHDDCFGGSCDHQHLSCESAGITRDRVPEILNQLRDARRSCSADHQLGEFNEPVLWNDRLSVAANAHARDMAENNFVSFVGTDSSTTETRVQNAEDYNRLGETILGRAETSASAINHWLDTQTDCELLLDSDFTEVGAACATAPHNDRGPYWSLVLGDPNNLVE